MQGGFDAQVDIDELQRRPGAKWHRHERRLAAWVADMDWAVAPAVADRLRAILDGGDLGYPDWNLDTGQSPAVETFCARMEQRYAWSIGADRCREWADVVQAVRAVTHVMTAPGERIVLHLPGYPPFLGTIGGRDRIVQPVHAATDGAAWTFDYDRLEDELADPTAPPARMWILCHPHNPLGHVFDRDELERIADIARRHDLLVLSDEIHADLTFPGHAHLPFAALGADAQARSVTVTSASKAFNLAGLRWAITHVGDDEVRRRLAEFPDHFFGAPNLFGVEAALAAWTAGDDWLSATVGQISANSALLAHLLAEHLPGVRYTPNRATYLAWLDLRDLGSEIADHPARWYRSRGVELSPGPDFGEPGFGHARLNFATDPALLATIVERLASDVDG